MKTVMVWVAAQAAPPGGRCQTASLVLRAARASQPPAGLAACGKLAMSITMGYMLIAML